MQKQKIHYPDSLQNDKKYQELLAIAMKFHHCKPQEQQLLQDVRNGNEKAVTMLAFCSEPLIFSVIKQLHPHNISIQEMYEVGKTVLFLLAKQELNNSAPEDYTRFAAWHIKKTIENIIETRDRFNKKNKRWPK